MLAEQFQRVILAAEFLFVGKQFVDGTVAIVTQFDCGVQLAFAIPLLEPRPAVASARDEMMTRRAALHLSTTKFADARVIGHSRCSHREQYEGLRRLPTILAAARMEFITAHALASGATTLTTKRRHNCRSSHHRCLAGVLLAHVQ